MKKLIEKLRVDAAIWRTLNNTAFAETAEEAATAIGLLNDSLIG